MLIQAIATVRGLRLVYDTPAQIWGGPDRCEEAFTSTVMQAILPANQSSLIKPMNYIYRADLDVEFIVSGFAAAKDSAVAVSRGHMENNVKVRVIPPSSIQIQQYDLQMLLLDGTILWFLTVQEVEV